MNAKLSKIIKNLKRGDIASIFGISETSVDNMVKRGCPRNQDKSFDLKSVIRYREKNIKEQAPSSDKSELELEKMQSQIEKLNLEILDKKKKTISREKFEEIQRNQASELMDFLKNGYKRNSPVLCSRIGIQNITAFNEEMDGFVKACMDAFIKGGKDID